MPRVWKRNDSILRTRRGLRLLCLRHAEGHSGAMTTVTGRNVNRAVGYESEAAVLGGVGEHLTEEQVTEFVTAAIAAAEVENKRVCLMVRRSFRR